MPTVADAMITEMTVTPGDATVGDVRELLGHEKVHMALLVADDMLVAVVERGDLDAADDHEAAAPYGRLGERVVAPDDDLDVAWQALNRSGKRRLAVAESDGRFRGLLCLKRSRTGFCTHADLAARRADPRPSR